MIISKNNTNRKNLLLWLWQEGYNPSEPKWVDFMIALIVSDALYGYVKSELEKWNYSHKLVVHLYETALSFND